MRSGLFQNRQGFPAAASRREADALLCRGRSFSRRGFWQPLCAGEGRGKCRNAERADANPEESNHTECRTPWRRFAKYILCLRRRSGLHRFDSLPWKSRWICWSLHRGLPRDPHRLFHFWLGLAGRQSLGRRDLRLCLCGHRLGRT